METIKKCGIYKITNINNNRCYIGSSIDIHKRWNEHKNNLRKNKHDNNFLQNSWNKHGEDSFLFEIIEIVNDNKFLIIREQFYLDKMKSLNRVNTYNICLFANSMLGFKHSDESKNKMSESRIGNKNSLGYKHTDNTKNKMSKSHIGTKHQKDTIIKMVNKKRKTTSIKYKTTKISNDIKNEIIERYKTGEFSTRMLSQLYNISKSTIWNITKN
jgi:group I intron endonuclease